jgi:hypothetical protein
MRIKRKKAQAPVRKRPARRQEDDEEVKQPKKRGNYAGTRRAIVSSFLRGKKWSREQQKDIFKAAAQYADAIEEAGGAELEKFQAAGMVGRIARQAGGDAFGLPPARAAGPRAAAGDGMLVAVAEAGGALEVFGDVEDVERLTAGIKREHRAVVAASVQQSKHERSEFFDWQSKQQKMGDDDVPSSSQMAELLFAGPAGLPMSMFEWAVPAKLLAAKALSTMDRASLNLLERIWNERHLPLLASSVPPVVNRSQVVQLCYVAGFCLCGPSGLEVRMMAKMIEGVVKGVLTKGTQARRLFDLGLLVIKFTSELGLSEWFHLGFLNLNTVRMTLIPLNVSDDPDMVALSAACGRVPLDFVDGGACLGMLNHWKVCQRFDKDESWRCSFFSIYSGASRRQDFCPGTNLEVVDLQDASCRDRKVWGGLVHRVPQQRRQQQPQAIPLADGAGVPGAAVGNEGEEDEGIAGGMEAPFVEDEVADEAALVEELARALELVQEGDPWDPGLHGDSDFDVDDGELQVELVQELKPWCENFKP